MHPLSVNLFQSNLHWENAEKNRIEFENQIRKSPDCDLVILPEMFSTGFSMHPEHCAEPNNGPTLQWMQKTAFEKNAIICGSVATKDSGKFVNRLYWVSPDQTVQTYDKRHLFRMGKEDQFYNAGNKKLITELKGWKICPLICYDLRFPVWSRNRFTNGKYAYDVLIYIASWPKVRSYPWKQLLIARAIENQCYVIGVNRVGEDGNGIDHSGDSMVINPRGEIMAQTEAGATACISASLDYTYLSEFRQQFPAGLDADNFEII